MSPFGHRRYERLKPYADERFRGVNWAQPDVMHLLESSFAGSATDNGVMGFKVMWGHLSLTLHKSARHAMSGKYRVHDLERRLGENTRFVWLQRRDRERQAISLTKALQSGVWRSSREREFRGRYVYDFPGIAWRISDLRRQDAQWRAFFDRHSIDPLVLYFEDCLTDLDGTIRRIAEWLEVPGDFVVQGTDEFKRQGGTLNEEWLQRYRRDARSPAHAVLALARAGTSKEWWASYLGRLRSRI
jgi:LPS sulfotransferase NodH